MAVTERTVEDIARDLAAAEGELNATGPVLLQRRIVGLQDELAAARGRTAMETADAKQRESARRREQLQAVPAALKTERADAVLHASTHRTVTNVARAFELDAQVVALTGDLVNLCDGRPEMQFGASTVKDSLSDLRRDPVLRHLFYRNPTERRPPVDRSRWAHLLDGVA
jgi:hypothetical protein